MAFSNSPLVTYTRISPNRTIGRDGNSIKYLTIHCYVGQVTAKQGCDYFASPSVGVSANYVVGRDGSKGLCVPESDRSWCTGGDRPYGNFTGRLNDFMAVTIETACDGQHPYAVTNDALNALYDLCTDICRRNGKTKLIWFGDRAKSLDYKPASNEMVMTVHRWFDSTKSCPGDYLYARMGAIANEVNRRLQEDDDMTKAEVLKIIDEYMASRATEQTSSWAEPAVAQAKQLGLMEGDKNAGFRPRSFVTREELAQVAVNLAKKQ